MVLDHHVKSMEYLLEESNEEHKTRLGNNLRYFRLEKELRQEDLADLVGYTRQAILSIEKGRMDPSSYMLKRIALKLGVPPSDLLYGNYRPKDFDEE